MTAVTAARTLPAAVAHDAGPGGAAADIYISLPTIHCAGCIRNIERHLNARDDVASARVNLSLKRVAITGSHAVPADLVTSLQRLGYEAHLLDRDALGSARDGLGRDLLIRMGVAGFAMMNVMLLSVAVWSGATDATRDLFHMISAAIAVPAVGFAAQPFFRAAWGAVTAGRMNMELPISVAILLATGQSLYESLNGGAHAYFDAALSLTFFLLIGRYLDHRSRLAARSAARELTALEVQTARRVTGSHTDEVAVSALSVGDRVAIASGMRVPVDGRLMSPEALTDRSFLTGESDARRAEAGEILQAGEIVLGAPVEIAATAVGEDTTLRRVAALVEQAENSRSAYTALADRAARIYAPLVHLLALVAFLGWIAVDGDPRHALNVAIAVLIITCPCALGLAVPAVVTAAIGRLYRMGMLVKSGTALERIAEVDTVIFDKTGTLSEPGRFADLAGFSGTEKSILSALAGASHHPVSRAVAAALPDQPAAVVTDIREEPGQGMSGTSGGQSVRFGAGRWLGADFTGPGLRIGDAPARPLPVEQRLRDGAETALRGLRQQGLDIWIVSGDARSAVEEIADRLGLAKRVSAMSAEGKQALMARLAADGRKVLMIGDGLNDTAALASAHASVAPASALDASRNAADIVMLRDNLAALPGVISCARQVVRLSRQNLWIASLYNLVAVPVAILGFATPLAAAIAMSASSISVLLNALRIRSAL